MPKDVKTGLALLREPFPPHQISKLPKPTKAQTEAVRNDFKQGIRCQLCRQWHHPKVEHLDYVGHAALTDRLLDCDPEWNWEPVAKHEDGTPKLDALGGMWIRLTVCGVTRIGYGHAEGKKGGDAVKEVIGDALRNAAMRFGAALDLWHKGQLHAADDSVDDEPLRLAALPVTDSGPAVDYREELANEPAPKRIRADDDIHVWAKTLLDGSSTSRVALGQAFKITQEKFKEAGLPYPQDLVDHKDKLKVEIDKRYKDFSGEDAA